MLQLIAHLDVLSPPQRLWGTLLLVVVASCARPQYAPSDPVSGLAVRATTTPSQTTARAPRRTSSPSAHSSKTSTQGWSVENPPGDWGFERVSIDTTEGTWISVDVSPDGQTIVFDLLGDIYTVPITGGDATPIRAGLAWHMQPRFSPDGSKIAFTSDAGAGDNLWVMNGDGSDPRAVTTASFRLVNNPAWAPSGQFIVGKKHFTSRRSLGAGEMWLFHVAGGKGVPMTKRQTEQKDVNDPVFSPDGRYLYFDRDATPGPYFEYNKDSTKQIYVIERLDRTTGNIITIAGGPGGAARPTPSPDGRWLAFVRRVDYSTTLFIKDLRSGEERPLYSGLERDNQEIWALHGVYPNMAWTPDSKTIVFWDDGGLKRVDAISGQVTNIPFRVRTTKRVAAVVRPTQTVAPDEFDVKMLRSVVVSPTEDRVAYVALGHIWVKRLPDGTPHRLTTSNDRFEHDPAFSPDGRSIVFATWSDASLGDLRIASVRGGDTRVITRRPGHYIRPKFSPDGSTVVFERVSGGYLRAPRYSDEPGIYRVSSAGGKAERLAVDGTHPHFGSRSDRLYFRRSASDDTKDTRSLIALDLTKRTEQTLYTSEGAQAFLVSPDGQWLAFKDGFNVFITPVAQSGRTIALSPNNTAVPIAKVTRHAGASISWSADAQTLFWSLGPKLFRRPLTDAFAFVAGAPRELPDPPAEGTPIGFKVEADVPAGAIALVGARIVTMKGEEVFDPGTVVVERNRITAVGPSNEVEVPFGALEIDVEGKTIIPGLIDAHAHGAFGTYGIIPQHNWGQFANLAFGVTTIHDPSNDTEMVFSAHEMQRAGLIRAPRIFSTGRILYGAAGADYKAQVDNLDDALFHLQRLKAVGAFSVKSYNQPRRDQRQQIIEAARRLGMQVMPEGGATFMHNMTMLVDGHTTIEHNIPVETMYDDVFQLWSVSDVAITPTLVVAYGGIMGERYWYEKMDVWKHPRLTTFVPRYVVEPRARRREKAPLGDYNHFAAAKGLKKLIDRGRLVNTGAHGQLAGLGEHWEIWMFAQGGMTPHEALFAATINPARTLGMAADLGSIEVGKLADLVVLEENPLDDIKNTDSVHFVMLNGRLFDAKTMDQVGHDIDDIGSRAFGAGPGALGIGKWWGSRTTVGPAHTRCSCGL